MEHTNPTDEELRALYKDTRTIAVVGASDDTSKPAHRIPAYLQRQGYRMIPVNPGGGKILGESVVEQLEDIDGPVDVVDVFRPAAETPEIARQAASIGARVLWLQTGIASEEAAAIARGGGMAVVMDECMGTKHSELGVGPGPHP